jgi:hypothetical protein
LSGFFLVYQTKSSTNKKKAPKMGPFLSFTHCYTPSINPLLGMRVFVSARVPLAYMSSPA